ncbi:MAG: hypothetical protein G8237_11090 [Magnetococcales bacterium]|nr:hypothetical protein [Magnetococcales bacterium]NGZ06888.1 hypothetical protein [Magnetococcales bacterium]
MEHTFQSPRPIPDFLRKDVVSKLAYVDESIAQVTLDDHDTLHCHLRTELTPDQRQILDGKMQQVIDLLVTSTRQPMIKIIENHLDRPVPGRTDPMPQLLETGQLVHTGDGMFSLGPLVAGLCRYFENRFFQLALSQGAGIHRFPSMIPASFLEKIQYFKNFPHSLSFAAHLRTDLNTIERFATETRCQDGVLHLPKDSFSGIRHLLAPTVCHNYYLFLANRTLPHPLAMATALGTCYRYESINMHSLERLWNFTMWEVIFVGTANLVKEALLRVGQEASLLLQEWGLAYRLENANDPFFIREFGMQTGFQNIYDLKYEYRARLPFKEGTLAVGSRNYHMDFFGRQMQIQLPDHTTAHSGCIGFGLERLAFAFLAQYGIDPNQWPESIRTALFPTP